MVGHRLLHVPPARTDAEVAELRIERVDAEDVSGRRLRPGPPPLARRRVRQALFGPTTACALNDAAIPTLVSAPEGYNHIGDIS
jgi:hypothetical protein